MIHESPIQVLLVEEDPVLAASTAGYLRGVGCLVEWVATAPAAIQTAMARTFDVILMDVMLPGVDGIDVCRALRTRSSIPIIIVSARHEATDRVLGLDAGADDYVTKPFVPRELLSRIRAVVRRARGTVGPAAKLRAGPIEIDLEARTVRVRGALVALTTYEFELLRVLVERTGHVLSREQLLDLARGGADLAF